MARQLRCDFKGGWYHVFTRGFQRQVVFLDDKDRLHFLGLLGKMVERYNVRLHAYVLMENHYHLLIETPEANTSRAMHWLNVSYSVWFNRHHQRAGALFQSRYKSVLIENAGEWALASSVYIHLNPVRVQSLGLDKTARTRMKKGTGPDGEEDKTAARLERLRGYAWSSYRAYVGVVKPPEWLTCGVLLARTVSGKPRHAYRRYLEEQLGVSEAPDDETFLTPLVVGGEAFQAQASRRRLKALPGTGDAFSWKRLLPFSMVVKAMEQLKGESWDSFVNRHGDWGRDLALYAGRQRCGMTLKEMGEAVDVSSLAVSQSVARMGRKLSGSSELRGHFSNLKRLLETEGKDEMSNV